MMINRILIILLSMMAGCAGNKYAANTNLQLEQTKPGWEFTIRFKDGFSQASFPEAMATIVPSPLNVYDNSTDQKTIRLVFSRLSTVQLHYIESKLIDMEMVAEVSFRQIP